ncbi:hypothetical protein [uncultured Clostridium sp.]|uniref:hypothetical protein n=1 Tax=uncultured Clostridium sp. TaxID=59620 RepID=UPI0025DD823A|nr:hypothetical protein [uncultured Clostridium sp.]
MVVGILIGILLMLSFGGMFYLGYRYRPKKEQIIEDEKEILKAKLRDEGFQNIMDYDIDVALGRRGINE